MVAFLISSCSLIKPVYVTSVGNFTTVNPLSRPEIRFDVGLQNPNNYTVVIEKMEIGISMGGPVLATVSLLEGTPLTKKENILVPVALVPTTNDISKMFNSGVEAFLNGTLERKMQVEGEITIKKFIFRRKYKLKESIIL